MDKLQSANMRKHIYLAELKEQVVRDASRENDLTLPL